MIICVCGPTGIGKTKLSETIAEKYNAIVLNADATQIYKELDIGSAKITKEEVLAKDVNPTGALISDYIKSLGRTYVIDNKTKEWLNNKEMCQYLRPETLFGTKFESYLNQKQVKLTTKDIAGNIDWSDY